MYIIKIDDHYWLGPDKNQYTLLQGSVVYSEPNILSRFDPPKINKVEKVENALIFNYPPDIQHMKLYYPDAIVEQYEFRKIL